MFSTSVLLLQIFRYFLEEELTSYHPDIIDARTSVLVILLTATTKCHFRRGDGPSLTSESKANHSFSSLNRNLLKPLGVPLLKDLFGYRTHGNSAPSCTLYKKDLVNAPASVKKLSGLCQGLCTYSPSKQKNNGFTNIMAFGG